MAEIKEAARPGFAAVVFSTFGTVFIAELGDKTQLATLLLSAQSGSPWLVFLGAALALICSSLVGVLLGQWLARTLPPRASGNDGRGSHGRPGALAGCSGSPDAAAGHDSEL